jgi:predicted SAM-dependent methyltransferase
LTRAGILRSVWRLTPLRVVSKRLLDEVSWEIRASSVLVYRNTPSGRRAYASARTLRDVKLNIGCGDVKPEGWFGIDVSGSGSADLRVDIRNGLPFADGSCRFIFSEHVFEHLDLEQLAVVLKECRRVLAPAGAIRIVVPDLARFARAYCDDDREFIRDVWMPQDASPTELLNGVFALPTHRFIHDFSSMSRALKRAGFVDIERQVCGRSRFAELCVDSGFLHRCQDSLYVEALKAPGGRERASD